MSSTGLEIYISLPVTYDLLRFGKISRGLLDSLLSFSTALSLSPATHAAMTSPQSTNSHRALCLSDVLPFSSLPAWSHMSYGRATNRLGWMIIGT